MLWSGDPREKVTYEGKHVRARDLFLNPQPVQRPRPPILVAGGGEQVTLRVAARHADVWHGLAGDEDTLRRKIALFDGYARACGRDPGEIVKVADLDIRVGGPPAPRAPFKPSYRDPIVFSGHPEEVAGRIREVVKGLGITYFIVRRPPLATDGLPAHQRSPTWRTGGASPAGHPAVRRVAPKEESRVVLRVVPG